MPKSPAPLSPAQTKLLAALDSSFETAPDAAVATVMLEARELEKTVAKYGPTLQRRSELDRKVAGAIGARLAMLIATDAQWSARRHEVTPQAARAGRREAEALKRDAVAALRYFLREDAALQARLTAIQEGAGLADLLDDLDKLAVLLDEHAARLKKADLPTRPAARARALAKALADAAGERRLDTDGAAILALRNRAFWYLREAMDTVREAGRYVFRGEPKIAILFRASTTYARRARSAKGAGGAGAGGATTTTTG